MRIREEEFHKSYNSSIIIIIICYASGFLFCNKLNSEYLLFTDFMHYIKRESHYLVP